ncbi:hypothetical protein D3C87_2089200 [compost metagenome]
MPPALALAFALASAPTAASTAGVSTVTPAPVSTWTPASCARAGRAVAASRVAMVVAIMVFFIF